MLTVAEYTEHYLCVTPNELIQAFEPDEADAAAEQAGEEKRGDETDAGFERAQEELAREIHDAVMAVERAQEELDREREAEMAAQESRKREPEPEACPAGAPEALAPAEGAAAGEVSAFALAAANLLRRK